VSRWAWILVAAAACAPAPPERLRNPKPKYHPPESRGTVTYTYEPSPVGAAAMPPAIDHSNFFNVDFHYELRWPLTPMNHPAMEPKFPIAQQFAQPGVGWIDLCGSGVTSRYGKDKEMLSYLRGWCKAVDGDTDAACMNLAPLIKSTTPRLEAAVRNDLANILAQGHADKAEHFIRVHALRDVRMLDLLAANYVEVGTAEDAITINRNAMDSDDAASAATRCLRLTKHIALTNDKNSALIKQVESYATVPKNADATCVREWHKLKCWASRDCAGYVIDSGGVLFDGDIVMTLESWGSYRTASAWMKIAKTVDLQRAAGNNPPGIFTDIQLAEIEIAAIHNAVRMQKVYEGCTGAFHLELYELVKTLAPGLDAELNKRLQTATADCL
jgi:hypothetical protein